LQINILSNPEELGARAAEAAAAWLNACIESKGKARLVLSTGASQFQFLDSFVRQPVDWRLVEMFHLDEYIALPAEHPASFRRYLRERFLSKVPIGYAHLVDGEGEPEAVIAKLEAEAAKAPFDLGLIGIGENAHIAFNDPPADFQAGQTYKVVALDEACKRQQVREGWFGSLEEVPEQAITMTVSAIMSCRKIISCVPHLAKAKAVSNALGNEITPDIPATILKRHDDWSLFLDPESASLLPIRS